MKAAAFGHGPSGHIVENAPEWVQHASVHLQDAFDKANLKGDQGFCLLQGAVQSS